jgi:short-subunit dehydrogenase
MGAYNVAKAGVVALTETLAAELCDTKVGVTVLCPTFFQTDIVKSGRFKDEKTKEAAQKMIAGGRTPEEIAHAAIAAVEHGRLYCVPMLDGRAAWRAKRLVPGVFSRLMGKAAKLRMPDG